MDCNCLFSICPSWVDNDWISRAEVEDAIFAIAVAIAATATLYLGRLLSGLGASLGRLGVGLCSRFPSGQVGCSLGPGMSATRRVPRVLPSQIWRFKHPTSEGL